MRIVSAAVQNFASYKSLNFNFIDQGLTLIQGATGSGKSTLCDVVPWVLWGKTAKGGAVSEVLSWPGDKVTTGAVHLETKDNAIIIRRSRGPNAKDNDLTFQIVGEEPRRGKDLPDTQKLINDLLQVDIDLYLAGAYFHEFSQTAQFFTTTAKNRRAICEQIVDLSLATKLQTRLTAEYKKTKQNADISAAKVSELEQKMLYIQQSIERTKELEASWATEKAKRRADLVSRHNNFENEKRQALETYLKAEAEFMSQPEKTPKCAECGTVLKKGHKHKRHNPFTSKIEMVLARENSYLERIADLDKETNPHHSELERLNKKITEEFTKQSSAMRENTRAKQLLCDLEILQEVAATYRSVTIASTIEYIEDQTNQLLNDHFDAEIRVSFTVEDADKLDVVIFKDGNICSYTQLSKGQRQLLKLCFGVAVMRGVANHHGINFEQAFFDEALDGLDEQMKNKAFKLLLTLAQEYSSIFVVEHSQELKEKFLNKYSVELVNGVSQIEKS